VALPFIDLSRKETDMVPFSFIRSTVLTVTAIVGLALPVVGHTQQLLPVLDLESQTMVNALKAVKESGTKVNYDIEAEITAASRSEGDAAARAAANARIVNGLQTVSFPAVGSVLKGRERSRAAQWCTGTLIGSKHVLTAAHCVQDDLNPASYHMFFQNAGLYPVEKIFWQEAKYSFPNADLAVLRLGKPVLGIRPMELNIDGEPRTGTQTTIIGFGRSGGSHFDYGIKRIGSVRLAPCKSTGYDDKDLLCWEYAASSNIPGADSNTCNADSGGPMLWAVSPTRWILAGITSGGTRRDCLSKDLSYDASVFSHRDWIRSVVGNDLGQASGVPPAVGDESTTVLANDGQLTSNTKAAAWRFYVREGIREVRITFNGEDDGNHSHDFDLEVNFVEDNGRRQSLCQVIEQSQFGSCQLENPRPGLWEACLSRKAGTGLFQVTVTQFH
jgi:V8-like Glu-specific endopeptidase